MADGSVDNQRQLSFTNKLFGGFMDLEAMYAEKAEMFRAAIDKQASQ